MIQVSFKSLCKNEAYERTKKILDNFAIRTGEKTWETFTTYQILNKLIKQLNKIASKNTCINIFIHHKNYIEHYITIGNKLLINEYNGIPISYSSANKNFTFDEQDNEYLKDILEFVTLFHDLGKNNNIFQNKLRKNSKKRDTIRHDMLSCIFLYQLLIKGYSSIKFFEINKKSINIEDVNEFLSFYFNTYYNVILKMGNDIEFINNKKNEIIFFLLATIILFHHKFYNDFFNFTKWDFGSETFVISIKNFLKLFFAIDKEENIKIDFISNLIKINLKLNKKIYLYKDFSEEFILEHIDTISEKFENIVKKINPNKNMLEILFYINRSYLMLIDHFISKKVQKENLKTTNYLLANNNQLLEWHLKKEKNSVEEFEKLITSENENITNLIFSLNEKNKKFTWQNKISNNLKKIIQNNKNIKGSITILNAETGYGKTIGILKILKTLTEDKLRFNFLYGMRILSKQTYSSVVNITNIDKKDISLILGTLNETINHKEEINNEKNNDLLDDLILEKNYNFISQEAKNKKLKELLIKPITIATIDYFTNLHKINKTKYLLTLFRISNSDLVIDEIDMFNNKEQIKILGHICFINGLFRRNVILSSATINEKLTNYYVHLYKQGYEYSNYINNKKETFLINLVNNFDNKILYNDNFNEKEITNFFVKKVKNLDTNIEFNKKLAKKMENFEDKTNLYETIWNNVFELHDNNKIKINGKDYSFGFVKFYYIKDLVDFLFYIKENNLLEQKNYNIKIQVLHSNLSIEYRSEIEEKLDKILNRNNKKYINEFEKFGNKKKNIFILLTTPIIEIGKDWDFDWGITQYINSISLIQSAGRIYRHRILKKEKICMYYFLLKNNNKYNTDVKDNLYLNEIEKLNDKIILNSKYVMENYQKEFNVIPENTENEDITSFFKLNYNLKFRKKEGISKKIVIDENNIIIVSNDKTLINKKINIEQLKLENFILFQNKHEKETYVIDFYKNKKFEDLILYKHIGIIQS